MLTNKPIKTAKYNCTHIAKFSANDEGGNNISTSRYKKKRSY